MNKVTPDTLTETLVEELRNAAATAGDTDTYADCVGCLNEPPTARGIPRSKRICDVINDARAQEDSE